LIVTNPGKNWAIYIGREEWCGERIKDKVHAANSHKVHAETFTRESPAGFHQLKVHAANFRMADSKGE
jgi:hypothetical protein